MIRLRFACGCLPLAFSTPAGGLDRIRPADHNRSPRHSAAQLEALSGEYTDPTEPDTPLSFYVQDGKLFVESERSVPTELKPVSATEFSIHGDRSTLRFTLDAAGQRRQPGLLQTSPAPLTSAPARPSIISSTTTSAAKP